MASSSIRFAWRSDTTSARHIRGGKSTMHLVSNTLSTALEAMTANAAAIGGQEWSPGGASAYTRAYWPCNAIFNTLTFSILMRFRIPLGHSNILCQLGLGRQPTMYWVNNTLGDIVCTCFNEGNSLVMQATVTGAAPNRLTTTVAYYDMIVTVDGLTLTSAMNTYLDGTLVSTNNFSAALVGNPDGIFTDDFYAPLGLCSALNVSNFGRSLFNEVVIWNKVLSSTTINAMDLVSTGGVTATGALNGAARTSWVDVSANDVGLWTSISAAEIKAGITQTQAGLNQVGTYDGADRWTTLTAAQVKIGLSFTANNVGFTGTYDGSDRWTTVTAAYYKYGQHIVQNAATITGTYQWDTISASNIRFGINHIQDGVTFTGSFAGETWTTITAAQIQSGVQQIQNGVTVTGTLAVPAAASGTAGTIDLANIREQIRYVLHINNTTAGYPVIDLSSGLGRRVQGIYTINPEKIPLQANDMPCLSVYLSKKDIEQKTIAKDQVNGKRAATLTWTLVGLDATQILPGTVTADDLDANLEKLMENTERVLRSYADLGGYTNWQFPTGVTYHSARIDDVNHMRVAFMDLQCKVYY